MRISAARPIEGLSVQFGFRLGTNNNDDDGNNNNLIFTRETKNGQYCQLHGARSEAPPVPSRASTDRLAGFTSNSAMFSALANARSPSGRPRRAKNEIEPAHTRTQLGSLGAQRKWAPFAWAACLLGRDKRLCVIVRVWQRGFVCWLQTSRVCAGACPAEPV